MTRVRGDGSLLQSSSNRSGENGQVLGLFRKIELTVSPDRLEVGVGEGSVQDGRGSGLSSGRTELVPPGKDRRWSTCARGAQELSWDVFILLPRGGGR